MQTKNHTHAAYMHKPISLFHLSNVTCSSQEENAAKWVHWTDQPGGQKTARHVSWEEEGRRNWEEDFLFPQYQPAITLKNCKVKPEP